MTNVLITGGAGFIGSHLTDELISEGYKVTILDNLSPQVHGPLKQRPDYLHPDARLIIGDVRDPEKVNEALKGIDVVFHFAAMVGVGQSMYEISQYTEVNNYGTAVLLEAIRGSSVKKLIVASSMSLYGEGLYHNAKGERTEGYQRPFHQYKEQKWELGDQNGKMLVPVPTPETKRPDLASIYALSKYDQEQMCLIFGKAYNLPVTAMRFFNVYGTRQALSNPYTGVLAIFASRFLNNKPPLIFEDGYQKRDFVHVADVARACRLAMESDKANGEVFNIGSGNSYTIRDVAAALSAVLNKDEIIPEITHKYRVGDIRHCFADIGKAKGMLGYEPQTGFRKGLEELGNWLKDQEAEDHVEKAGQELASRGLTL